MRGKKQYVAPPFWHTLISSCCISEWTFAEPDSFLVTRPHLEKHMISSFIPVTDGLKIKAVLLNLVLTRAIFRDLRCGLDSQPRSRAHCPSRARSSLFALISCKCPHPRLYARRSSMFLLKRFLPLRVDVGHSLTVECILRACLHNALISPLIPKTRQVHVLPLGSISLEM